MTIKRSEITSEMVREKFYYIDGCLYIQDARGYFKHAGHQVDFSKADVSSIKGRSLDIPRLVWLYHGRKLLDNHIVCPKNGKWEDTRIANLQQVELGEYALTATNKKVGVIPVGKLFKVYLKSKTTSLVEYCGSYSTQELANESMFKYSRTHHVPRQQ